MKGAVVVLAHPRTGSSLLMQTLVILGMPWIGSHHREDLPAEANPKGYFEDRRLLSEGITPEHIARVGSLDGRAVKISLPHLMLPGRLGQWRALEASTARLFIPIRHPLESAVSQLCFAGPLDGARDFFLEVTSFLYNYAQDYHTLAARFVHEMPGLSSRTVLIPYTLHIDDPRGFVETVRAHAGITVDRETVDRAVRNIEGRLYRVRADAMPDEHRSWYERLPARIVYETLRSSPRPWEDLLA